MATFAKRWTPQELDILLSTQDLDELEELLPNRSRGAIKSRLEIVTSSPWTEDELKLFPENKVVNSLVMKELTDKIPGKTRNVIWQKLKESGYIWDKSFSAESSDDNPYPDHGKKWTQEEIARFPQNKEVTAEILAEVQALIPRRKPTSIWPKMKSKGYVWAGAEEVETKSPSVVQNSIGKLSTDELILELISRLSPLPWDATCYKEISEAYRTRSPKYIEVAALKLHKEIGEYLNV
jgi:hypothetical protein